MLDYEFSGVSSNLNNTEATEKADQGSFLDFIDGYDYSDNKCLKKAKKAVKVAKKHNKKIKQLSSKHKTLEKEVLALKADMELLKKSAYDSKFAELVNSDNITERKRLANELHKMEV